jgi:hypothetical protein
MTTTKGTAYDFTCKINQEGGINEALENGLQSEEYSLPPVVNRRWNDLRAAYAAYVTVKQYFTDAAERAGLEIKE